MSGSSNKARVAPELGEDERAQKIQNAFDNILCKNRTHTDVVFLLTFILFITVWLGLMGYCMLNGNMYRILNGYDNCGNICGRNNIFAEVNGSNCHGMDMTMHKYLRVQSWSLDSVDSDHIQVNRICVENCSNYSGFETVLNRCVPQRQPPSASTPSQVQIDQQESLTSKTGIQDFFQEVAEDIYSSWKETLYMCAIAFVFSIITLVMFKFLAGVIVWLVLIGVIFAFTAASALLWIHYMVETRDATRDTIGKRRIKTFLILAIISTIITVALIVSIIFMRKRIKLVIVLFKEAGKAASDMPLLLLEPILTFIAIAGVIALWLYFSIWIESSGRLAIQNTTNAKFIKDDTMKATRWYNMMALFWLIQFSIGCQHMAIAGAVAVWYFARNKNDLDSPILTSFSNLVHYHLGTVALGSLLIALIQMFRLLLQMADNYTRGSANRATQCCTTACQCCLGSCQSCLQYINRNAYIETAIYGDPFFRAGSKAYNKLMSNRLRVFTINTIGDFVLFLGKVFVVAITLLCGTELLHSKTEIHHIWVPLTLAGFFAYLISHCFITVYEMMIDTIFLCFCEDCEMNDGLERPYFMPATLMDFVQNSKKVMGVD